jgi:hypothetical protein
MNNLDFLREIPVLSKINNTKKLDLEAKKEITELVLESREKVCSCCSKKFVLEESEYIGDMGGAALFNCTCGSTLAVKYKKNN